MDGAQVFSIVKRTIVDVYVLCRIFGMGKILRPLIFYTC